MWGNRGWMNLNVSHAGMMNIMQIFQAMEKRIIKNIDAVSVTMKLISDHAKPRNNLLKQVTKETIIRNH